MLVEMAFGVYVGVGYWPEMSIELTSGDVICISRQFAIVSSENKGVVFHWSLVAFVELHAGRAAILMELADAVNLVAASIPNILHHFCRLLRVRHRLSLALVWTNDIVVVSWMIEHICSSQELVGLEQTINLSRLRMRSICFLLEFLTSSFLKSVINFDLRASFGV